MASTPASSALLIGESGVGKEVVAAYIHEKSERRNGPFVRVNLAAIPETTIEAELFGSVRSAFTDAKRDRAGHFASAEGGTILLDEVFEFKAELQPKLLDVRVLAATSRDPMQMIERGLLREDLYYRLSTVVIRIPPLRDRRDDVVAEGVSDPIGRRRADQRRGSRGDLARGGVRGACARLPILAVTACASPNDRERAAAAGMDGLLVKPVDPPRLLSAIARHTARRAA